MNVRKKERGK